MAGRVVMCGALSLCRVATLHWQAGAQGQCPAEQSASVAARSVASRPAVLLKAEQSPVFVSRSPHRKATVCAGHALGSNVSIPFVS